MDRRFDNERSALSRYLSEIGRIRPLSGDEEREVLEELCNGGRSQAIDRLVQSNLSFVVRVAAPYRNLGLPFEDLLNEGNLGLIEAAQRYDPGRGVRFITYAVWWVRKAILRALGEKVQIVRVPHSQQKKIRDIRDARKQLQRALGREPDTTEIAERVELKPRDVERLLQVGVGQTSLDGPVASECETPLRDLLEDLGVCSEQQLLRQEALGLLRDGLAQLNEQQSRVIELRFGLGGEPPMTLKQVGARMELSRERVRQVELQARGLLAEAFSADPQTVS